MVGLCPDVNFSGGLLSGELLSSGLLSENQTVHIGGANLFSCRVLMFCRFLMRFGSVLELLH